MTGDDLLIEYVDRLNNALQQVSECSLKNQWKAYMDRFINHYVWSKKESSEVTEAKLSYSQQVLLKLNEMKERRRRLVKYTYQKEFKGEDFEKGY